MRECKGQCWPAAERDVRSQGGIPRRDGGVLGQKLGARTRERPESLPYAQQSDSRRNPWHFGRRNPHVCSAKSWRCEHWFVGGGSCSVTYILLLWVFNKLVVVARR